MLFGYFVNLTDSISTAGMIVMVILFAISFWAAIKMPETFGKELDYVE